MIEIRTSQSVMKAFLISVLLLPSLNGMVAEDVLAEEAIAETSIISQLLRDEFTPLHIAAYFDRVAEIEQLLEEGAKVEAKDKYGATALHIAAKRGNLGAVQSLISYIKRTKNKWDVHGIINAWDASCFGPLYYATLERKIEVIQCLVENGACGYEKEGPWRKIVRSPLDVAAQNGDLTAVKYIMSSRRLFNDPDSISRSLNDALFSAARGGSVPVIEYVIEAREPGSAKVDDGNTPLLSAARPSHAVIPLLTDRSRVDGADHDNRAHVSPKARDDGSTPLLVAAQHGYIDAVRCLLVHGASLNEEDHRGNGALQRAARGGHVKMLDFLLEQGLDINHKSKLGSQTPLDEAVKNGHANAADLLLSRGAQVDRSKMVDFMKAAAKSDDLLEVLLKYGAPIDLDVVVELGSLNATRTLLERGVPIKDALHKAAQKGNLRMMELLLAFGADIDAMDSLKIFTPLSFAALFGQPRAVQFLLERGANILLKAPLTSSYARYSRPKEDRIVRHNHIMCTRLLLNAGAQVNLLALALALANNSLAAFRLMLRSDPDSMRFMAEMSSHHDSSFAKMPKQVRSTLLQYLTNREFYLINGRFRDEDNLDALFEVAAYFLDCEVLLKIFKGLGFAKLGSWRDESGKNLLMGALEMQDLEAALLFLNERICDINDTDREGHDALWFAVGTGELSIVNELLAAGAKINHQHVWNAGRTDNLGLLMKLLFKFRYRGFPPERVLNLFT